MKRMMIGMVAGLLGLIVTAGLDRVEDERAFIATAVKKDKAAMVDGVAGTNEYPSGVIAMKQTPDRDKIQGEPAQAHVFHDGKVLYVSITVPFKESSNLSKGEAWGTNDGAEVCFRDASGTKAGTTLIVHGFVTGKYECAMEGGASEEENAKLSKAVKFAAKVDPKSWTGEWAIPFMAAGIDYKAGIKLGFNLGVLRSEGGEWIIWRGAEGDTYNLDKAGTLILE